MNNEERDRILEALMKDPQHRMEIIRDADLSDAEKAEAEALVATADLLWVAAHGAPPIEDDPVAAMLGLVSDPHFSLDPKALSRARKQAGLTVGRVASQLRERGWDVRDGDVFRWESRSAPDVPPALVQAIASVVGTDPDRLMSEVKGTEDQFAAVRGTKQFQELVERWMKALNVSSSLAVATLESRMVSTVHRGELPDAEQLLAALGALVSAVEESRRGNGI